MRVRHSEVPYGVARFEKIRLQHQFYVDKTAYIDELERYSAPVFLRPRRFGKSLWCSTLECYYDIKRIDSFDALFGGLAIGKEPTSRKNSHLVLSLDFSKISVSSAELVETRFDKYIQSTLKNFRRYYKEYFLDFDEPEPNESAALLLDQVTSFIRSCKLPNLYVIIDEYDNFTNTLALDPDLRHYEQITRHGSFFQTFFKVLKAGLGEGSIETVFITGVLAITLDDLTSGFNVAQIITLKPAFHGMLGFNQTEVEQYVDLISNEYQFDPGKKSQLLDILKIQYDGYTFVQGIGEALYNSSSLNYFLHEMTTNNGNFPAQTLDEQLKTNMAWLKRLSGQSKMTLTLLNQLMETGLVPVSGILLSKYNAKTFFDDQYYASCLFYLGVLTWEDENHFKLPNVCMKQIIAEHYAEMIDLKISNDPYQGMMMAFLQHQDLLKLFGEFWESYKLRQPGMAFAHMSENHIQLMFNEVCYWHLHKHYHFSVEVNRPSGRTDWEMQGNPFGRFPKTHTIVEFKYVAKSSTIEDREASLKKARVQAHKYCQDIRRLFPDFTVKGYVIQVISNESWFGEMI